MICTCLDNAPSRSVDTFIVWMCIIIGTQQVGVSLSSIDWAYCHYMLIHVEVFKYGCEHCRS